MALFGLQCNSQNICFNSYIVILSYMLRMLAMSWIPDEVHNYYEDLLKQYLHSLKLFDTHNEDYIADFCCLVLN